MLLTLFNRPYRFFLLAAVLALLLCLLPIRADDAQQGDAQLAIHTPEAPAPGIPAGADLSQRTEAGCYLHQTLYYAPCGHSVQRRDPLDARLIGLTRTALEKEIDAIIKGAAVTGFSAREVDAAINVDIPCPLHWILKSGEDGFLHIYQNRDGTSLALVRSTDIPVSSVAEKERAAFEQGRVFDDVQSMEGVLESMSS